MRRFYRRGEEVIRTTEAASERRYVNLVVLGLQPKNGRVRALGATHVREYARESS